jgi:hypothetical protein
LLPLCPLHLSCPSAPSILISFTAMAASTSMALVSLWDYCCCGPPSPSRCPFRWVLKKSLVTSAGRPSSRRARPCHPRPAPLCCPERHRSASWTRALNVHTRRTNRACPRGAWVDCYKSWSLHFCIPLQQLVVMYCYR